MASQAAVEAGLSKGFHSAAAAKATASRAPKRRGGKGRLVLVLVAAMVMLGGAGLALAYAGVLPTGLAEQPVAVEKPPEKPILPSFVDLPSQLVNLRATGRETPYLQIRISLELASPDAAAALRAVQPRVAEKLYTHARTYASADLRSASGIARLRDDLLGQANAVAAPLQVRAVLFREFLLR